MLGFQPHLLLHPFVIVHDDSLDRDGGSNYVPEATHPHVSIFDWLCAQDVEPVSGLEVQAVLPTFLQRLLDVSLGQVAVQDISKQNFVRGLNRGLFMVLFNVHDCSLKVDNKVPFGVERCLEELDFLNEFPHVSFHPELDEPACISDGSLPWPQLSISLLNDLLVLGDLLELPLQVYRHS
jgi:hypothetical protein